MTGCFEWIWRASWLSLARSFWIHVARRDCLRWLLSIGLCIALHCLYCLYYDGESGSKLGTSPASPFHVFIETSAALFLRRPVPYLPTSFRSETTDPGA